MQDFLFADDAAIVVHFAEDLQQHMNHFSKALPRLWTNNQPEENTSHGPERGLTSFYSITISTQELEVVCDFV